MSIFYVDTAHVVTDIPCIIVMLVVIMQHYSSVMTYESKTHLAHFFQMCLIIIFWQSSVGRWVPKGQIPAVFSNTFMLIASGHDNMIMIGSIEKWSPGTLLQQCRGVDFYTVAVEYNRQDTFCLLSYSSQNCKRKFNLFHGRRERQPSSRCTYFHFAVIKIPSDFELKSKRI